VSRYIDEHRARFGVEPICRTLDVSASAYYQRRAGVRSARSLEDERLLAVIRETHKRNYEAYGYRRLWKALLRKGERGPRCQVQRLMAEHGIRGAKRRGRPWRTTTSDPRAARRADLVERDFTAKAPNRLWVADFTYLRCWQGVLFFAFIIDVFSRMVVGWQLASNMRTTLVLDALRMALGLREPGADVALVHHSDLGSQYTSIDYTQTLDDHAVLASVGSVGDAYDNALAESFVDSYKTELIADRVWCSRAQVELATVAYLGWFNHHRLHESLGDIPPVEFEQLHAPRGPISGTGSVTGISPRGADGLSARLILPAGADEHRNAAEDGARPLVLATAAATSAPHDQPPVDERAAGVWLRSALRAPSTRRRRDPDHYAPMREKRNPPNTVSVEPGPAHWVLVPRLPIASRFVHTGDTRDRVARMRGAVGIGSDVRRLGRRRAGSSGRGPRRVDRRGRASLDDCIACRRVDRELVLLDCLGTPSR